MRLQTITNPISKVMFKGANAVEKAPVAEVKPIGAGLNQPVKDEFVKEVGMKVARAKSEVYAYKYMSKLLKKLSNVFTEDLNNMVKSFSEKEQNVVESNTKYIAKF